MDQSSFNNKMVDLRDETKVKFNVNMHGISAGQILKYGRTKTDMQTNIRRRLADNDGSVEIIEEVTPLEPKKKEKKKPKKQIKGES